MYYVRITKLKHADMSAVSIRDRDLDTHEDKHVRSWDYTQTDKTLELALERMADEREEARLGLAAAKIRYERAVQLHALLSQALVYPDSVEHITNER